MGADCQLSEPKGMWEIGSLGSRLLTDHKNKK